MNKILSFVSILILVLTLNANSSPKNIIIFIADGWGYNQLDATAYWNGKRQNYESWDCAFAMSTYMYHEGNETKAYGGKFVGVHGYDPKAAWNDWNYMMSYSTDSGAAATAMSTGVKTYKGSICYSLKREPLFNISQQAFDKGKAVGVVTSVQLSHATPAGFVTHNASRGNYAEIAEEMINTEGLRVVMGAGHPDYDDDGNAKRAKSHKFVGGKDNWELLRSGTAGGKNPWTLIDNLEDFNKLADNVDVPDRVFAVAPVRETLQYNRSGLPEYSSPEPPYSIPFIKTVPTLKTMLQGALNVLETEEKGFLLMVEGGAIDWAGHDRLLGRQIEESNFFNETVETSIEWIENYSNWDETLMIITGDHETGYLWGEGVISSDSTTWFKPISDNGPGKMPGYKFYSEPNGPHRSAGHSNQLIPFFARGGGSYIFDKYAINIDPKRGRYINNSNIAHGVFELWK